MAEKTTSYLHKNGGWFIIFAALAAATASLILGLQQTDEPFAGFFYGPNMLVSVAQRADWPGPKAGIHSLDRIIKVNNKKISTPHELRQELLNTENKKTITYTIKRGHKILTFSIPVSKLAWRDLLVVFLAPFFIGILFLANGALVFAAGARDKVAYLFLFFCFALGMFYITLFEAYTGHTFFWVTITYPIFGALAVHLFLNFPKKFTNPKLTAPVLSVAYAGAAILITLRALYFRSPSVSAYLSKWSSVYMAVTFLCVVGLLAGSYFYERRAVLRRRVKVLLPAVVLSSLFGVLWIARFLNRAEPFYLDEALLLSLVLPVTMSYAILKENLFDIDAVIRRSVIYGLLTALIFAIYILLLSAVSWVSPSRLIVLQRPFFALLALAVVVLLFNPLRKLVQSAAYRWLFPGKYKYMKQLDELGEKLKSGIDLSRVAHTMTEDISIVMGVDSAAFYCKEDDGQALKFERGFGGGRSMGEVLPKISCTDPFSHWLKDKNIPSLPPGRNEVKGDAPTLRAIRQHGFIMIVPLKRRNELLGFTLLGPKRGSDEVFSEEDMDLIRAVSNQASIALENAILYRRMARQEQLAAVGRLAGVIVHEVKNPLGIIKVSAGTIKKLVKNDPQIIRLAGFIEEEVDRMNSTILKILHFARPDKLVVKDLNVKFIIEKTIQRYSPSLKEKGINIKIQHSADEITIRADAEKVERALTNLLLNAADAMPAGGTINIWYKKNDPNVEIGVTDTGAGIPPEIRDKIFDPFFTTKEGGGGLGLAIVWRIMKEHGGKVYFKNGHKGSTFILSFSSTLNSTEQ